MPRKPSFGLVCIPLAVVAIVCLAQEGGPTGSELIRVIAAAMMWFTVFWAAYRVENAVVRWLFAGILACAGAMGIYGAAEGGDLATWSPLVATVQAGLCLLYVVLICWRRAGEHDTPKPR